MGRPAASRRRAFSHVGNAPFDLFEFGANSPPKNEILQVDVMASRGGEEFTCAQEASRTRPSIQWAMTCIGIGVSNTRPASSPLVQRT